MDSYVGIFRSDGSRGWCAAFPDLPECTAVGSDFAEAVRNAGHSLADALGCLDAPPRSRSLIELTLDAVTDRGLAQSMKNAVLHTVQPIERPSVPIELLAARSKSPYGAPAKS